MQEASNSLTDEEREKVQNLLGSVSFTCGAPIEDFDVDLLVYTQSLNCLLRSNTTVQDMNLFVSTVPQQTSWI